MPALPYPAASAVAYARTSTLLLTHASGTFLAYIPPALSADILIRAHSAPLYLFLHGLASPLLHTPIYASYTTSSVSSCPFPIPLHILAPCILSCSYYWLPGLGQQLLPNQSPFPLRNHPRILVSVSHSFVFCFHVYSVLGDMQGRPGPRLFL